MKRLGQHIILDAAEAKRFVATAFRWALREYHIADDAYWDRVDRGENPGAFNIDIFLGGLWYDVLKGEKYEEFLRFFEGPS